MKAGTKEGGIIMRDFATWFTATYEPQPVDHTRRNAIAQLLSIGIILTIAVVAVTC